MKYGDSFKEELKDDEFHKKEKNANDSEKNFPNKKTLKKDKEAGKKGEMKKVMAGKMDKYMTNMECEDCGKSKKNCKC